MEFDLHEDELITQEEMVEPCPTFEDLAIDDTLSDLERVTRYVCSSIPLQRVIHVKMIEETARSVGFRQTCDQLVPLLERLVCDVEYVVRQHVAYQFPPLSKFLVTFGGDEGYQLFLDKLVPLVGTLISDSQHEVRGAASDSLVEMAALVKSEDQGQHILTIVLPLAHEDDNEQLRISAVNLYHGLAEFLGEDLCRQFCVPELISLSEDPVFRVRKFTAQSFPNVCKTAGLALTKERLFPAFSRLAKDDIWGVRKACAESLVNMANSLEVQARGELLVPLFEMLAEDSSRWVKTAAYQNLGPLLVTLAKDDISDALIDHFLSMALQANHFGGSEVDMKYHCAYSFPAIVQLLGPSEWPRLLPAFELLTIDTFWKIRRTFAYSLHELARMLGTEITEAHLATVFDSYLRDAYDVKMGVILHFADFLETLSPSFRESYLPVLSELETLDVITKWRFREIVSKQLAPLCQIFSPEATFAVMVPLVYKLVTDEVAIVRQESYRACPLLVAKFDKSTHGEWIQEIVDKFITLAHSKHYHERQIFLGICEAFLAAEERDRNLFNECLAPKFMSLATDPVSNVRLLWVETFLRNQAFLRQFEDALPSHWRAIDDKTQMDREELQKRLLYGAHSNGPVHAPEEEQAPVSRGRSSLSPPSSTTPPEGGDASEMPKEENPQEDQAGDFVDNDNNTSTI